MFGIDILGSVVNGVSDHFKGKQAIKKAKVEAEKAQIKAKADTAIAMAKMASQGKAQEYDLDKLAMQNMEKSWKDEVILIVFLTPLIMAFIPALADYALKGFTVIQKMPEWYQYTLIGMIIVIYGMRGLLTKVLDSKNILKK